MIGKMYRPLQILRSKGNRGFMISHKYKTNFGGTANFETDIYLEYDANKEAEVLVIDFRDLQVPIVFKGGHRISAHSAKSTTEKREIHSLRKISRPTKVTSKDYLEFSMKIESKIPDEVEDGNDMFRIYLLPVVRDNTEHMFVEVGGRTPVVINSTTKIIIEE